MTDISPNKQALLKIRELKQQIAELQQQQPATYEPIAIVSMACRFPRHSSTPEAFWESLIEQKDEVSEIPDDRWDLDAFHDDDPEVPGKMYARQGVFLDNIDLMDPEFFGISPREATWVDPQQRLLMEVGWEALENAGWTPEKIGSETGIFVGWMHNDYQNEASDSFLNLNPYIATGAAGSFLCGRLAYYLGLQGPSVAIDTACSSSLVALHLACQSLQKRDCERALVGGVNAICSPTTNILTCKLKALSPSGHSRAFDADADGYLRGEGCGVVTLRRLEDAIKDGDPVLGVISGSAIGHNGFSSGLTAPNPKAQEKVIRQALERAQLSPQDVSYLEAHGTGTELGDPIEMRAAANALTTDRSDSSPLLVGSVKTNIGHLEAAAGMAGLIKVLLSLQHNKIPGQLNFETPNPHIAWDETPVKVLTEATDWPHADQRVAGVSAFGMSGTNAHVVVSGVESLKTQEPAPVVATENVELIPLSAKSEQALQALAEGYAQQVEEEETLSLADLAFTASTHRSHFEHRAAIVANDVQGATNSLSALATGILHESLFQGNGRQIPKIAWQFTGQGSQYVGMARGLYNAEPVFREALDQCESLLKTLRKDSLIEVMFQHEEKLNHTSWTQPAIFAVQMGLAKLLMHHGLTPNVVFGHSVGQYAAACVAGVMSWEDGLRLIAERGRLIGELPSGGRMLAVFAPLNEVDKELTELDKPDSVSIAAMNGTHIVISGDEVSVSSIKESLTKRNIRSKALTTSHAFHSSMMQPALDPFREFAERVEFKPAQIPLICNISGKVLAADAVLDGEYWSNHIREAVRYADCVETAQEISCDMIVELGPQSVLTRMAPANWTGTPGSLFSCLQKNSDDRKAITNALAQLYVNGATPDFETMYQGRQCQRVQLPNYPFQRRRFWGPDKPRAFHSEFHTAHPLLGGKVSLAGMANETRYESYIEPDSPPWLPDHEVMGQVVLPGAAYLEMAIAAAQQPGENRSSLSNIVFEQPLRPTQRTAIQTIVKKNEESGSSIEFFSAVANGNEWTRNCTANIDRSTADTPEDVNLAELKESCGESVSVMEFYQKMHNISLNYGPMFQTIDSLHCSDTGVLTHLQTNGDIRGFTIPPTILDGALHSLAVGLLKEDDGNLFLPVSISNVHCFCAIESEVWCHAEWVEPEGQIRVADLTLFNETGEVVAKIIGLKVQQISQAKLRQLSGSGAERLLYELKWQPQRLPSEKTSNKKWLIVHAGSKSLSSELRTQLKDSGNSVTEICLESCDALSFSDESDQQAAQRVVLNASRDQHWDQLFDDLSNDENAYSPNGIVWLIGDHEADSLSTQTHCEGLLNLSKALQRREIRSIECGFQLITEDAIATEPEQSCNAEQTKYWGFGRVLGAEQPACRCRLLDVNSKEEVAKVSQSIIELLLTETHDNQFVLRDAQFLVPRLTQVAKPKQSVAEFMLKADASYLITGGLGMLGRQAAKWLAEKGATQVVLISRRSPGEATQRFLLDIEALGCEVIVHSADLGLRSDVETMFQHFGSDLKPLAGVIHAAGLLNDALIGDQTWESFEKVLAPKINGAKLLDEFTRELSLDFFVLYSSVASVLGSPGQSNYATGNAYLDGLAFQRRANGLPAISINWGPWTAGMADDERIIKRLRLQGISPLEVAEAHAAMEQILTADLPQATVIDVDWRRMRLGLGGESPPLLERLTPSRKKSQMGDSAFVTQLKRLKGNARKELLITTVQSTFQGILNTAEAPETDRPLIEMGLDSLMAVEFSTELQMKLGDQFVVGPTMLFDHPTIDAISDHLLEMVSGEAEEKSPEVSTPTNSSQELQHSKREPIAIIGMSCRFPGAKDLNEFWNNLLNGVDSVCEIPSDRWDIERFYNKDREPGKMYTREGGFLDDIADFDANFFNISDQEACWIDPQHRMLLENSYKALEHAGIPTSPLEDTNVGVFMGIMGQDYAFLPQLDDDEIIKAFQGAGLSHSAGVGRISYVFGFEGPSIAVDTASSSSLVALYQAVRSLQDGNCNMALAGGVNAILAPVNSLLMSKAGLLSPDGRCKSFSADANGFGRGEGCGVVVLKRLSDAQRDGDTILSVVRGGAVVHNGFSGGITSPSGKAQGRVITGALQDAKIAPSQVQYLEAHGTGTEFGDPMELSAAAAVYGKGRKREEPLLVGSVKANISHLEAAGGISGLIKTVLSLHHGLIPPQAHFDSPSPHISWKRLPVKMVTEATPWPDVEERIAGVTALGLVGTNAHVILSSIVLNEQTTELLASQDDVQSTRSSQLLVLSARDKNSLSEMVASYATFLEEHPDIVFEAVCYSAAVGRRHFEHRLAITAESQQDAITKLAAIQSESSTGQIDLGVASSKPNLAWHFSESDHNTQRFSKQLYKSEPVFRELIASFDERLESHAQSMQQQPVKLNDWFTSEDESTGSTLQDVQLYVLQAGLATLWKSWGIEPDAVSGLGVGQYAAACSAGVLCYKDALTLVLERERALREIAANTDELEAVLDRFEKFADTFNYYPPNIPLVDSLSGDVVPVHRSLGGSYWRAHVTHPDSNKVIASLLKHGCHAILEIGPNSTLDTNSEMVEMLVVPSIKQECDVTKSLMMALGELYHLGINPDFKGVHQFRTHQHVPLPHYPFQKKRFWITEIHKFIDQQDATVSS